MANVTEANSGALTKGVKVKIWNNTLNGTLVMEGEAHLKKHLWDNYWEVEFLKEPGTRYDRFVTDKPI